jgi:hypothetical protein
MMREPASGEPFRRLPAQCPSWSKRAESSYESPAPREPSQSVRVRWIEGGKEVVQVRRVAVSASSRQVGQFTASDAEAIAPPKPVKP